MLPITTKNNNQSFNIKKGEKIILELYDNASTGYKWTIPILQKISPNRTSMGNGIGTGSKLTYEFIFNNAGKYDIIGWYQRPWLNDFSKSPDLNIRINIACQ